MSLQTQPEPTKKYTILVVEDEVLLRLDLAHQLRGAGFEVVEADSGDEAVAILKAKGDVDLILSDIRMPGEIDGAALARSVRGQTQNIKRYTVRLHRYSAGVAGGCHIYEAGAYRSTARKSSAVAPPGFGSFLKVCFDGLRVSSRKKEKPPGQGGFFMHYLMSIQASPRQYPCPSCSRHL